MKTKATVLGERGERAARSYLESKRWKFIAEHFRTRQGELDLIMQDGNTVVFIEVKTRRTRTFGAPEESVSERKLERMGAAADIFLQRNPGLNGPVRFDLIVLERQVEKWRLRHFRGIGV